MWSPPASWFQIMTMAIHLRVCGISSVLDTSVHLYPPRNANQDDTLAVVSQVRQGGACHRKHHERSNDPIQDERDADLNPEVSCTEQSRQLLVLDLCQSRPHHDDQPDDDG